MSEAVRLEKAVLGALQEASKELDKSTLVPVQFNPESLKVSFSNQVTQPQGGGNQTGTDGQQFVGAGSTKLSLQLWFDASLDPRSSSSGDVRDLTSKVARFMQVKPSAKDPKLFIPPQVRFSWGSFEFDGIMESREETLEFFASDGRALRASLSISLSQQRIAPFRAAGANKAAAGSGAGEEPLAPVASGSSVQQASASTGRDWKQIAAANNIENPRHLAPGTRLNLNPRPSSRLPG
jgi:hypothetical protein